MGQQKIACSSIISIKQFSGTCRPPTQSPQSTEEHKAKRIGAEGTEEGNKDKRETENSKIINENRFLTQM